MNRSTTSAVFCAVLLVSAASPVRSLTLQPSLNFAAVNQSQWAAGRAFVLDESLGKYIQPTLKWDVSSYDLFNTSPTKLLMQSLGIAIPFLDNGLSTSAGFGTRGTLGFDLGVRATTGHVAISYPVAPTLRLPDKIDAGKPFALDSSWGVAMPPAGSCALCWQLDQVTQAAGGGYAFFAKGDGLVDQAGKKLFASKPVFDTFFPAVQAWADLSLQASGDVRIKVEGKVGAFGIEVGKTWEQRITLPTIDKSTQLLRVDSRGQVLVKTPGLGGLGVDSVFDRTGATWLKDGVNYQANVDDWLRFDHPNVNPWLHVQGHIPKVDTKGALAADGRTLRSAGQDDMIAVSLDVPHLAGALLDAPLAVSFPSAPPNLKLDLVSGTSGPVASIYQSFTFDPRLTMELHANLPISRQLANGSWTPFSTTLDVPLGESVQLRTPVAMLAALPNLTLKPVYRLDNTFTNETGVALSIDSNLDALTATFPSPVGGDLTVGPLVPVHGRVELGKLPLYKESFPITGFAPIAQPEFTLDTVSDPQIQHLLAGPWAELKIAGTDPDTGKTTLLYRLAGEHADVFAHSITGSLLTQVVATANGVDFTAELFTVDEQFLPGIDAAQRVLCLDCRDLSFLLPTTAARLLTGDDQAVYFSDLSTYPDEPVFSLDAAPIFGTGLHEVQGSVSAGFASPPVITTVPEPASGWMIAAGIGLLVLPLRRAASGRRGWPRRHARARPPRAAGCSPWLRAAAGDVAQRGRAVSILARWQARRARPFSTVSRRSSPSSAGCSPRRRAPTCLCSNGCATSRSSRRTWTSSSRSASPMR